MRWKAYSKYRKSGVEWFGSIPEHWEFAKLKYGARVVFSNVDKHTLDGETAVRLCNYVDVYYKDFITKAAGLMKATATSSEIARFTLKKGDVLITKDSEAWDDIAVPAYVASDLQGVLCGYHLALIRVSGERLDGGYLFRSFCSRGINDQFRVAATGITRYGLGKYSVDNGLFVLPPLAEQRGVAEFLDRETERIDALIEKKERQIELLQEKRAALISHAVTKGLDPNAKMKDSGIEWLGKIPAHWDTLTIKRLSKVRRGASPRPIDDPVYFDEEGEYAWVRISDVTASSRYLEVTTQRLSSLGKNLSVPLEPGNIFLSIAASVGKPIIAKIKCCIHDGFVYFPDFKHDVEFLYYIFASGQPYLGLGKLGTQLNLNTDTVGDIHIAMPPAHEQEQIVSYLDNETAKGDSLLDRIRRSITILREYRSALISAAVAGKIDVREEVA